MAVDFRCVCGGRVQVGEEYAGTMAKCPHCGRDFVVPAPAAGGGERLRGVSTAGLWLGIAGCGSGMLFLLLAFVAAGAFAPLAFFLTVAGAAVSVLGIVFGAMGLKAQNVRYKPHAVGGLVTGIVGTCIAGVLLPIAMITVFGNQVRDQFRISTERLGSELDATLDSGITDSAAGKVRRGLSELKDSGEWDNPSPRKEPEAKKSLPDLKEPDK
ncbi:MAG: hypothetical protein FJ290_05935 [Planctomycetes bacterium]|nr:hypothetical protein [Planctomycetota bacterium]